MGRRTRFDARSTAPLCKMHLLIPPPESTWFECRDLGHGSQPQLHCSTSRLAATASWRRCPAWAFSPVMVWRLRSTRTRNAGPTPAQSLNQASIKRKQMFRIFRSPALRRSPFCRFRPTRHRRQVLSANRFNAWICRPFSSLSPARFCAPVRLRSLHS